MFTLCSFIIFRISLFRFYKLGRSMSFISLKLNLWLLNLEAHRNYSIPLHPHWFKSILSHLVPKVDSGLGLLISIRTHTKLLLDDDKWYSETRMWQPRFRVLRFLASISLIYLNCWSRIIVLSCELVTSFITISHFCFADIPQFVSWDITFLSRINDHLCVGRLPRAVTR
jgi:hypothetical protein